MNMASKGRHVCVWFEILDIVPETRMMAANEGQARLSKASHGDKLKIQNLVLVKLKSRIENHKEDIEIIVVLLQPISDDEHMGGGGGQRCRCVLP